MAKAVLSSLAALKGWLKIDADNVGADDLLNKLLKAASAAVLNHMNRDTLALTQYSETYDGYGKQFMMLRHNPVYRVLALAASGAGVIPAAIGDGFATPYSNGYALDPYAVSAAQRLTLYGRAFPKGRSAVNVRYTAGFVTTETQVIDATSYRATTDQMWLGDIAVFGEAGEVYNSVSGALSAGQYSANGGVYQFSQADAGNTVLITYSYVPADIEQVVWEIAAERYRYLDRIGYLSKSLGGQETVTYAPQRMNANHIDALASYVNVVPV